MEQRLPFHVQLKQERERHGWTQAYIANHLQIDLKTVARWERGQMPRPFLRQQLANMLGKSTEELGLLEGAPTHGPQADWGESPSIRNFYGRQSEIEQLKQWIVTDRCHLVAILGMGGIGKTTFATWLARTIGEDFDFIFWRSLQHAPTLEYLLKQCIQFISGQQAMPLPDTVDEQISLLIQQLRSHRCLLILDNAESLLQPGQRAGHYLPERESYETLFQRIGQVQHQSCLILTSREKTRETARLEGKDAPVRSLKLKGLSAKEGQEVLHEKELSGTNHHWKKLTDLYSGNPLALQLVSEIIKNLFGGHISQFLAENQSVYGDINDLLEQQFQRLPAQEQMVLYWLAIEREAVTLDTLRDNFTQNIRMQLLDTLTSLQRRFLLEMRSQEHFVLQPVILEYVTNRLIGHFYAAFQKADPAVWANYALLKARARDYVRESQLHFILLPLTEQLRDTYGKKTIEQMLLHMLEIQRQQPLQTHNYLAGNVLNLLLHLRCDLRGIDFSSLIIRQAHLQDAKLPGANFANASFLDTNFTDTFGNIYAVTFSSQGNFFALGTSTGDIWIYQAQDNKPLRICRGHNDGAWSVNISADERLLVSSSDDQTIRIWDLANGECVRIIAAHHNRVRATTLNHNNKMLISGSDDHSICLWDMASGAHLHTLYGHKERIWAVAISPDDTLLASGSTDGQIRLWDMHNQQCLHMLQGHTHTIRALSFSPDGKLLASCSDDWTIRIWKIDNGKCLQTLQGHGNRVWTTTFDSSGRLLASGSEDHTTRLWDTQHWRCLTILQGHTQGIRSVAFSPDGQTLLSGAEDQSARLWDSETGFCFKTLKGYTNRLWSIALTPDGQRLASGGEDQALRIWDTATGSCLRTILDRMNGMRAIAISPDGDTLASGGEGQTLRLWNLHTGQRLATLAGHTNWIWAVAFSADGKLLASGSEDKSVRIWQSQSGDCLLTLKGHQSWIRSVAFSPDSSLLASGADDYEIKLWDSGTGQHRCTLRGHTNRIRAVAFSPDGSMLASSSEDQTIRLWSINDGTCLYTLTGHSDWVRSIAFSPDGSMLASSGEDQTIRLWDPRTGQCLHTLHGHQRRVRSIAFRVTQQDALPRLLLASGGDDGEVMLWNVQTRSLFKSFHSELPYESMNISGASGLTDAQKASLKQLGAVESGI